MQEEYAPSSLPLDAKGEKESKKEEGGGSSGGIKKKSSEKKKEKKSAKKKKEAKKLLVKQLSAIDVEKARFTKHKIRLNLLRKKRPDLIDKEVVVTLFRETRAIYENVLALYHEMLLSYFAQQQILTNALNTTEAEYAEVKRELIDVQTGIEAQDVKAKELLRRWKGFQKKMTEPPEHKKGDKRLTRTERVFIRQQAEFLKQLYDDVTSDTDENADLVEREKALVKQRALLKAKKNTLRGELAAHIEEDKKLRSSRSKFKRVNVFLTNELESMGEEEEEEEEVSILSIGSGEEEEEEEGVLSETVESETLETQINWITANLVDGDYTALNAKFNQPHHDHFLAPLIEMYRLGQWLVIAEFSLDYMTLLLDERASLIAQLYEVLVAPSIDYGLFVNHVMAAQPPLHIVDAEKKVLALVARARNSSKLELLKAIRAFVNDEVILVEEEAVEEEEAGVWVSDVFEGAIDTRAAILFAAYEVIDMDNALSRHSCVYRAIERDTAHGVIIKIVPELGERNATEDRVHESLANIEGFAELKEFFRLDAFPLGSFKPCPRIRKTALHHPVHVYVTEYLPLSFRETVAKFSQQEKLCTLFELLVTLRDAKKKYGIQHNQLDLENIRFKEAPSPRSYASVKCLSPYRVTLIDLGMASLDRNMTTEQRSLLSGMDYNSFYRLTTRIPDMYVSDAFRNNLPEGESAPFAMLMALVASEMTK